MTTEKFINKAEYDNAGQKIWAVSKQGEFQMLLDLRGWGSIQHLFKNTSGAIDFEAATKFQDELGEWIADAINQKLTQKTNK